MGKELGARNEPLSSLGWILGGTFFSRTAHVLSGFLRVIKACRPGRFPATVNYEPHEPIAERNS